MKNDIHNDKAQTNIFRLHNQPHKTTRNTKKLNLVWGGGKEKEPKYLTGVFLKNFDCQVSKKKPRNLYNCYSLWSLNAQFFERQ